MKNIKQNQLKSCIVITFKAFRQILKKYYGKNLEVHNEYTGISFWFGNPTTPTKEDVCQKLTDYFGVEITSFHSDDEEPNTHVWIVYHEDRPWLS